MNKTITTTILSAVITASTFSLPVQAATGVIDKVLNKVEKANVQNTKILSGNNDIKADLQILSSTQYAQISEIIEIRDILEPPKIPIGLRQLVAKSSRTLEFVLESIPREELADFLGTEPLIVEDGATGPISLAPASKDLDGCNSGTKCADFRKELILIVADLESVLSDIVDDEITEGGILNETPSLPMNMSLLKGLLSKIPGQALFPFYMTTLNSGNYSGTTCLVHGSGICELRELISMVKTNVEKKKASRQKNRVERQEAREIEDGTSLEDYPYEYYKKINCENTLTKHPFAIANSLAGVGYYTKGYGKVLITMGNTYLQAVDPSVNAGGSFIGEIVGKIDANTTQALGDVLDGIGDIFLSIADSKRNKLRHCVGIRAQLNIWDKLNSN